MKFHIRELANIHTHIDETTFETVRMENLTEAKEAADALAMFYGTVMIVYDENDNRLAYRKDGEKWYTDGSGESPRFI